MKRQAHALLAAALLVAALHPAAAQYSARGSKSSDILPFKATERTLANGLKVIIVPTGFPNIVSLQIPVQTGSRNEVEPGKSGFAHFFEHIMSRGTKTMTQEQANEIITRAGARENAYTTDDYTNYYITFAKEDLEPMIRLEADRFQNLSYSEEAFKTESRAVLGEYNKNSASPGNKLYEVVRDSAFTTHTYKHTTMGFIKDIENMPTQFAYSKTFFDRWYRPERTTIIVSGDVSPAEVMPLIEKYWGRWQRGTFSVAIPKEPPPIGPKYAHVDWASPTLPYIFVAFRNPAFSETNNDNAAMDFVATLWFGPTSELFKKLVQREQKVDGIGAGNSSNADPELFTITARVKKPEDIVYVRDEILKTVAKARSTLVPESDLAEAKSNERYSFVRSLDNTDRIASTLATYVRYDRSFNTINRAYALYDALTPADLQRAARTYFVDNGLIVGTLSSDALPAAISTPPKIASLELASVVLLSPTMVNSAVPARTTPTISATLMAGQGMEGMAVPESNLIIQRNPLPQLRFKMLFNVGSAVDPAGKEGLAVLASSMIARAGSKAMTLEQINKALYPMAGSFGNQVDKEMTTFTGSIHRDNWRKFLDITLPMLLDPAFSETDFKRVKDAQLNALREDLRSSNEEELAKERLQANLFQGTAYAHPVLGTVAGIEAITLDDVKAFVRNQYTRGNLMLGINGDIPQAMIDTFQHALMALPAGTPAPTAHASLAGKRPSGMEVEIIQKETRASAISFGLPISITRASPDFAALNVARAWLGEHRMSTSHLYQRIRGIRGMNYGDYAYIEAFPRGMFQFFPDANIARRGQIFEVWIRPVVPENAQMALRLAVNELDKLVTNGMSEADFQATRQYLMKNVYVMTATQDQQLGYALDSKWYGIPEYTGYMRSALQKLTRDDVNRAIKKHLSAKDLSVVIITKDASALRDALVADGFSAIKYDAAKPDDILAEDKVIGARKLGVTAEKVHITPVEQIFAK